MRLLTDAKLNALLAEARAKGARESRTTLMGCPSVRAAVGACAIHCDYCGSCIASGQCFSDGHGMSDAWCAACEAKRRNS